MTSTASKALLIALLSSSSVLPIVAHADDAGDQPKEVIIKGQRTAPNVPTTTEGVTAEALGKTVNVVTPEDTLRYVPNVLIRQRHIGDTQSPITTRTSGVGASARSLIYVDGILLSSLIGNNNSSASPKWGLIAPEAVARVDVLYGPFSAAYAGNSLGSVIEFTTRMPSKLEATLEVQGASQAFRKYGDDDTYGTLRYAGSLGNRNDRAAWRISYNHLDSHSQPLSYISAASAPAGTTGAYDDASRLRVPVKILGTGGLEHQVQDNLSGRLTYDLSPALTAAYTFGLFRNDDRSTVSTYLRNGAGDKIYTAGFSSGVYRLDETQLAQGLSLTSHRNGAFDFSLTASSFAYLDSHQRTPTTTLPAGFDGGAGTGAWLDGTGWHTLDAKGTWRPDGPHLVTFGAHLDTFKLDNPKYALSDWTNADPGAVTSASRGRTETRALWLQDVMRIGPRTKLTLGLRGEAWRAYDGVNYSLSPALNVAQPALKRGAISPKVVLAFKPKPDWTLKASVGAATRFPTVSELYQAITTGAVLSVPNPNLRPERALSSELSAGREWDSGSLRVSVFDEHITDALLSQSAPLLAGSSQLFSYVQNVDRTHARGIEIVGDQQDVLIKGLQVSGWVTWVDAKTTKDTAFAAAVDKNLPQIPKLRAALVVTYSRDKLDLTLAARYSDRAFATIDNSDTYANTYQGFSGYAVVDAHARYRMTDHWTVNLGVNNLNNRSYFLFHPFTQRTVIASLKYSY